MNQSILRCFLILAGLLPATCLHAQLTAFQSGGKWGFKNAAGKEVVPARYAGVGRNGLATSEGKVVDVFAEGLAPVTVAGAPTGLLGSIEGGKWGFIDAAGKEVTPLRYDAVEDMKDGYAVVTLGGKQGLVSKSGREVIAPRYEAVQPGFAEGLAAVQRGGRWGYVNEQGKEVIAPAYYAAKPFAEGLAAVAPEQPKAAAAGTFAFAVYGFIDKRGKMVISAAYRQPIAASLTEPLRFEDGEALVEGAGGSSVYINKSGAVVTPGLRHRLYELYTDSYAGFAHSTGSTLLQDEAAKKQQYYNVATPVGGGMEAIGVDGNGRKLYVLSYDLTKPEQAAAAKAALPAMKSLIEAAIQKGWRFTAYARDYSGDAEGNRVTTVLQRRQGLPDPRTAKIRLIEGEKKIALVILGGA